MKLELYDIKNVFKKTSKSYFKPIELSQVID